MRESETRNTKSMKMKHRMKKDEEGRIRELIRKQIGVESSRTIRVKEVRRDGSKKRRNNTRTKNKRKNYWERKLGKGTLEE